MVFPDRKRRHHWGCPDYNVPWIKIHSRNDQHELALVSKLSTITLKNVGWCQATQETNAPDNTHGNFIPISSRQEVEEGPLETKANHKLLNLSECNPHFQVHQETTQRYKVLGERDEGNSSPPLASSQETSSTTLYFSQSQILRADWKYPSGTCKEHV